MFRGVLDQFIFFTSCSTALQDSGKWLDHQGAGLLLKVSDVYVKPFCRYHNSFIHSFHSGILYLSPGDKRRIKSHSAYTHKTSDLLLFMALDSQKSCIRMSKDFESWLPVFSQEYVRHACSFVSTVTVKSADTEITFQVLSGLLRTWPFVLHSPDAGDIEGRNLAWVQEPSLGEALMGEGVVCRREDAYPGSRQGERTEGSVKW